MKIVSLFKRVTAALVGGAMLFSSVVPGFAPVTVYGQATTSLYRHFEGNFLVGNIWSSGWRGPMNDEAQEFLRYNFNAVTAEDYHKPDQIIPSGAMFHNFENVSQWNWARAERIIDFAEANNMAMIGHTLVWHSQSPLWLTGREGASTTPLVNRSTAMYNMERYINEVAGRWAGRIFSWDVVNEVFTTGVSQGAWNQNPDWRAHLRREGVGLDNNNYTRWYDAFANGATGNECGSDYIYYAFRFTRLADPSAILYYNDFNEESPGKREAIAQMVEDINARWRNDPLYDGRLLIEVIGMQSHYHLDQWATNFDLIRPTMERFIATGARISITELDITMGTSQNPLPVPLTREQQQRQANAFARLFGYYLEFQQHINRVSIWGMADDRSWRAWGQPTLSVASFEPKEAFNAVLALGTTPTGPSRQVAAPAATPAPDVADDDDYYEDEYYDTDDNYYEDEDYDADTTEEELPSDQDETDQDTTDDFTVLAPAPPRILRFAIGNANFTNQGITQTADAPPFIDTETDRTMLPLRVVADAFGVDVSWDDDTRVATIQPSMGAALIIAADDPLPGGMGSPMIVSDRVFVPARYVVEMLGASVEWDAINQAVYVNW